MIWTVALERAILGAFLSQPESLSQLDEVSVNWFRGDHQVIFEAILRVAHSQGRVTPDEVLKDLAPVMDRLFYSLAPYVFFLTKFAQIFEITVPTIEKPSYIVWIESLGDEIAGEVVN